MIKRKFSIIALVIIFSIPLFSFASASYDIPSSYKLILEVPVGDKDGEIGLYIPEMESLSRAPEAFEISPDGTISILDTFNKRIVVFKDRKFVRNINLDMCDYPAINFTSDESKFYVLDQIKNFYIINKQNNSYDKYKLEDNNIARAEIINDTVNFHTYDLNRYTFQNSELIPQKAEFEKSQTDYSCLFKNDKTEWLIDTKNESSLITNIDPIRKDKFNNLYTKQTVELYQPTIKIETSIHKYSSKGDELGYTIVNFDDCVAYPLNSFVVTDDGRIYLMLCKKSTIEIHEVILGTSDKLQSIEWHKELGDITHNNIVGSNQIQTTEQYAMQSFTGLLRSQAESRANQMAYGTWTVTSYNKVVPTDVQLPSYVKNASLGSTLTGIPYCWGGFNHIDNSNNNSFFLRVTKTTNATAGNVLCTGYYKSGTIGLDCSGFATAVYGLPSKMGSWDFYSSSFGYSKSTPQNLDYYVNPGVHVLLHVDTLSTTLRIVDSSTEMGKVAYREVSKSYVNSYTLKSPWPSCTHGYYDSKGHNYFHYSICGTCGIEITSQPHSFSYVYHDSSLHIKNCAICGYATIENHAITYGAPTSYSHKVGCSLCNTIFYEESHTFTTVIIDGVTRYRCTKCGYLK